MKRSSDRRRERTLQMLRQASIEVMQEKGFKATSIQDITSRANLNRGTFYAHFQDKYALLEALIREEFARSARDLPPVTQWESKDVHQLIWIVLENFRDVYRRCYPLGAIDPLVERVIQEELAELLLRWLNERRGEAIHGGVPKEVMARGMSWAIVGEALQWSNEPGNRSSKQVAQSLLLLLMEGVDHLAPDRALRNDAVIRPV